MARSSSPIPPQRPSPRLYLATPVLSDAATIAAVLPELLAAADVAAVLLRLAPADDRTLINRIKALAPAIQNADAALLLDGHVDLVARSGADGAHLTGVEALAAALPRLRPERIAGVSGLATRHEAMLAGEAGADYLLFGEPDAEGRRPAAEAIAERVAWWAELFEPPCVAAAGDSDEIDAFTRAGADFILLGDMIWSNSRGPVAVLREAAATIASAYGGEAAGG